jgi:hypothetical protein
MMDDKRLSKNSGKGGGKQVIVQRSIQVDINLWEDARRKAVGQGSLSEIIRKLLRLWIEDRINLDDFED